MKHLAQPFINNAARQLYIKLMAFGHHFDDLSTALMKKQKYPIMLSLAVLTTLAIFLSFKKAEVPANQSNKNQDKKLKAVSFRVVNDRKSESVFIGWNLYAILKVNPSSASGAGC